MALTSAFGRQRQKDLYEFEASFLYIVSDFQATYGHIGKPGRKLCRIWNLMQGTASSLVTQVPLHRDSDCKGENDETKEMTLMDFTPILNFSGAAELLRSRFNESCKKK